MEKKEKRIHLEPEEYDYSKCPKDHLEVCYYHEYARESLFIRKRVKNIKSLRKDGVLYDGEDFEFDENENIYLYLSGNCNPILLAKGFPQPFLKCDYTPPPYKTRGMQELKYAFKLGQVNDLIVDRFTSNRRYVDRSNFSDNVETVVCRIDWSKGKEQIKKEFNAWLDTEKENLSKVRKETGKARHTIWKGYLHQLVAWRLHKRDGHFVDKSQRWLADKYKAFYKEKLFKQESQKFLYQNSSDFYAAVEEAEKRLISLFCFGHKE